jgi:hypothetical protein
MPIADFQITTLNYQRRSAREGFTFSNWHSAIGNAYRSLMVFI